MGDVRQTLTTAQGELIADLQRQVADQNAVHAARAQKLETEVKQLAKQLLGPKTEKIKIPPVERDFDPDSPTDEERAKQREETARIRRERAVAKQQVMEAENVDHPVAEEAKHCPKCKGTRFGHLGYESSTTYEYVPARFVRRNHRREKVACACGEHIVVAPPPPKLVPGGQYGFGFAAFLVVEKCADSIPIHRLEKRFARLGIPMSRATMNDVLHAAAECALPLVARLQKRVASLDIVLADETSMRIQDREKRGFFWVFHGSDERTGGELALYVFATNRSGETPETVLGGTKGSLIVDGYTGYNNVPRSQGSCQAT